MAKAVGTAAVISGNRVALGVGMGWMEEEFALLEQPFARRGKRADEMLEVLAKLWGGGWVEHHGEFYDFDRLEMSPTPTERDPDLRRRSVGAGAAPGGAPRRVDQRPPPHRRARARSRATLHRYREELGKADEPFAIVGSTLEAGDLDGYRRVADAGVTHLLTMPWVFYSGFTDDLSRAHRRHPPLRRRHHRQVLGATGLPAKPLGVWGGSPRDRPQAGLPPRTAQWRPKAAA